MASVLLSDIISHRILNSLVRILIGLWLLTSIVLLATFSGRLYELLTRPPPIDKIDSWNDLYTKPNWKQSKIYGLKQYELNCFIDSDPSDMALDFKRRFVGIDRLNLCFGDQLSEIIEDIFKQNAVGCFDGLGAYYSIAKAKKVKDWVNKYSLGHDYHVSEKGFGTKPYFFIIKQHASNAFKMKLNLVILIKKVFINFQLKDK